VREEKKAKKVGKKVICKEVKEVIAVREGMRGK